ncbi:LRR and NB-ARC domains-containing diseaseresistance protein, partial [Striga asiatica]
KHASLQNQIDYLQEKGCVFERKKTPKRKKKLITKNKELRKFSRSEMCSCKYCSTYKHSKWYYHLVRETIKNPLKTVSSRIGARTPVMPTKQALMIQSTGARAREHRSK